MTLQSSPAATARVIVVDDDDYVREVTEMILAGAGHTVRATANGYEALRWLEEQPCDLLILDLRMPKIDGLTLYREVLARWPTGGPRVLFVSGFPDAGCCRPSETLQPRRACQRRRTCAGHAMSRARAWSGRRPRVVRAPGAPGRDADDGPGGDAMRAVAMAHASPLRG